MSNETIIPPAGTNAENPAANAAFAAMRIELEKEKTARAEEARQRAEMEERLKTIERRDMDELNRTKAEKDDLTKRAVDQEAELIRLRDEHGKFVSAYEAMYTEELTSVPADKVDALKKLSASGSWSDRYDALRTAKGLLPPPPGPAVAGTRGQPAGGTPPPPNTDPKPETIDPKTIKNMSWGQVLPTPPPRTNTAP